MAVTTGMPEEWGHIVWNPPVHRGAAGAYVDAVNNNKVDYISKAPYRAEMLGPDGYATRMLRKGVIFQHTANTKEWEYDEYSDEYGSYQSGSGRDGNRYGFRFHYNPSTIKYGMGIGNVGINPAIIMSGAGQSMPITPGEDPANVSFTIYLNRIEDMTLMDGLRANRVDPYQEALRQWQQRLEKAYKTNNPDRVLTVIRQKPKKSEFRNAQPTIPSEKVVQYFYGKTMSAQDLEGIYERGTGYDLEFLFRTLLGKPWETLLRGTTADVGIAFGVPMILDFNSGANPGKVQHGQRYLGRVNAISYNHLSFNSRMVPMWTEVGIDFMRYPDVVGVSPPTSLTRGQQAEADRLTALAEKYAVDRGNAAWAARYTAMAGERGWSTFYTQGGIPQILPQGSRPESQLPGMLTPTQMGGSLDSKAQREADIILGLEE